jgi:hypothetical protein
MSRRRFGCFRRGPLGYNNGSRRGIGVSAVGSGSALNGIGLVVVAGSITRVTGGWRRLDGWSDVDDLIPLATRLCEEGSASRERKQASVGLVGGFHGPPSPLTCRRCA